LRTDVREFWNLSGVRDIDPELFPDGAIKVFSLNLDDCGVAPGGEQPLPETVPLIAPRPHLICCIDPHQEIYGYRLAYADFRQADFGNASYLPALVEWFKPLGPLGEVPVSNQSKKLSVGLHSLVIRNANMRFHETACGRLDTPHVPELGSQ